MSYLEAPEFLGKTALSADEPLQELVPANPSPRRRVSNKQLDELRARLSGRDHQILEVLQAFNLATVDQIRRQVFVGHASQDSAKRIARRCLKRLHAHDLLEPLGRRVGGIKAGSSGTVWTLTPLGHRLIGAPKRKSRYQPSITHIRHVLAITELATDLIDTGRNQALSIDITTEPDCWRSVGGQPVLKPDLFAKITGTDTELVWWIEIDRGTESSTVIRRKLEACGRYWLGGQEQGTTGVFPLTLWVTPDAARADFIRNVMTETPTAPSQLFAVTTASEALSVLTDFGEATTAEAESTVTKDSQADDGHSDLHHDADRHHHERPSIQGDQP